MIKTGLVSVTFRTLSPMQIVELVAKVGLQGIEWGGDIHVPHGDIKQAKLVGRMTEESSLEVASYGSYYRVVDRDGQPTDFTPVLDCAVALGAPLLRVWAGQVGSNQASSQYRERIVEQLNRIGALAQDAGRVIGIEYHGNTLTDTHESAQYLIKQIDHANVKLYWQQPVGIAHPQVHENLKTMLSQLAAIHVFYWNVQGNKTVKHPLAQGRAVWMEYLKTIQAADVDIFAMLEFVKDGSVEQFVKDADTLKNWLEIVQDI